ncbi:hypothetical protein [Mixta sp. Marseille-Q2659]|uniref:hypothetical protein n=1 Tax=Mixta sp. Marseille-Q2659 TaxID=2736607 RepID=UPI0023B97EC7|nr:hypothetical protein [Mixta sp. Marseille-Q2659]
MGVITGLNVIVEKSYGLYLKPVYYCNLDGALSEAVSCNYSRYICDTSSGIQLLSMDSTFLFNHAELVDLVNKSYRYANVSDFLRDIGRAKANGVTGGYGEWGGDYNTLSSAVIIEEDVYIVSLAYSSKIDLDSDVDFYKQCLKRVTVFNKILPL